MLKLARWIFVFTILVACDRRREVHVIATCDDVAISASTDRKSPWGEGDGDVGVVVTRSEPKFVSILVPYVINIPAKSTLAEKP